MLRDSNGSLAFCGSSLRERVTNLQITVLIDQNITRLQIPMNNSRRVHIFQPSQYLIQEVLDELLLEWSGGKKSVQVGTQEFCHEVAVYNLAPV
jgi:hypothetical protein